MQNDSLWGTGSMVFVSMCRPYYRPWGRRHLKTGHAVDVCDVSGAGNQRKSLSETAKRSHGTNETFERRLSSGHHSHLQNGRCSISLLRLRQISNHDHERICAWYFERPGTFTCSRRHENVAEEDR